MNPDDISTIKTISTNQTLVTEEDATTGMKNTCKNL